MFRLIVVAILVALVLLIIFELRKPKVVRKEEERLEELEVEEIAMDTKELAVKKERELEERKKRLENAQGDAPEN